MKEKIEKAIKKYFSENEMEWQKVYQDFYNYPYEESSLKDILWELENEQIITFQLSGERTTDDYWVVATTGGNIDGNYVTIVFNHDVQIYYDLEETCEMFARLEEQARKIGKRLEGAK